MPVSPPAIQPVDRRSGFALPHWCREPLLHFLLLGVAIFALDRLLVDRADDPNVILVDASVDEETRKLFRNERKRDPETAERGALRRAWLDNEVLYRHGLELGLDRGDNMIRDRVIFKALSVIETGLKLPPIDDAGLKAWFEARRARYDEPPRFDFQEAVLPTDTPETALNALAASLNSGAPGDARATLNAFKARPYPTIVQSYGETFAQALQAALPGEWRVIQAKERPRLVRLDTMTPATQADFAVLRNTIMQDWVDATMAQMRTDAVRALEKKYTVKVVDGAGQ